MAKILVIDDEELICWFLQRELSNEGHKVSIAFRGKDGIEKFRSFPFQFVITDLKLPDISGFEVIKIIKNLNPDAKIIAMTAWKWEEVKGNDFKNSLIGFFEKPLDLPKLKEMLSSKTQKITISYPEKITLDFVLSDSNTVDEILD